MTLLSNKVNQEIVFKELFEKYYAPFCLYARRFIGSQEICEDIVSDVFVNIWAKRADVDLESNTILGYIKMSIKNNCLNHIKHQSYEINYAEKVKKEEPSYSNDVDSIYTVKELKSILKDSLSNLPDEVKQVFIENIINKKTQSEIAEEMGVSVKTINRYKARAMKEINHNLKDYLSLLILLLAMKV